MRLRLLIALALCASSSACGPSGPRPLSSTMCHEPWDATAGGELLDEPTEAQWIALLTRDDEGEDRGCGRALARLTPVVFACGGDEAPAEELRAIRPRLAAYHHREGMPEVVWVGTHMTRDGRVQGPVALIERTELGLEVQAVGGYLGVAERVDLRVHRAGGAYIVAVESTQGADRVADLLVQSGGALVVAGLVHQGAACERARVVLQHREESPSARGWIRRTVRTATLGVDGPVGQGTGTGASALVVTEHVMVRELSASDPEAPARATHDADGARRLRPDGAILRSDQPPLPQPSISARP